MIKSIFLPSLRGGLEADEAIQKKNFTTEITENAEDSQKKINAVLFSVISVIKKLNCFAYDDEIKQCHPREGGGLAILFL